MFPRDFYEVLHIIGIALVFSAIGGVAIHAANGGARNTASTRRLVSIVHGIGMLLILVGGFGMLARMGFQHGANFPGWLWVKLIVWLLLGGLAMVPYRKPEMARPFFVILPLLAGVAVYMALYKPF